MSAWISKIKGFILQRDVTLLINFFLDQCIPPILRDAHWFMKLPLKLMFSSSANKVMEFKQLAPLLDQGTYGQIYEETVNDHIPRDTDLNKKCLKRILKDIQGNSILEVGCGRGYLAGHVVDKFDATSGCIVAASDIVISQDLVDKYPSVQFTKADSADLPFDSHSFDTVVCTHVLEHVLDFHAVVRELRRVAKNRLIIVVPMQRPYKYTFDLHIRFFPYPHSFLFEMRPLQNATYICENLGRDLYFVEDFIKE